jgi:UDP-N-acetylmuramate dehydrogenase
MQIHKNFSLQAYNTFGIEAMATYFIEYQNVDELKTILLSDIVRTHRLLHIGSGSNLLFLNDFDGVILHSLIKDIVVLQETEEMVVLKVGSGVVWDDFVAFAVQNSWGGIENLSFIPGEVGASAVQNIGAYGVEAKDVIKRVHAIEVATGNEMVFALEDCRYGYRDSIFKHELKGKFIVTAVEFCLQKRQGYQLTYQHLEEEEKKRGAVNLLNIRRTIIEIRESKLPDPAVAGNAGSFFMNPVVSREHFDQLLKNYPEMPHYHVSATEEKIPAAWLIDQCGWKGKTIGQAGVHDRQALVLVNKGGARGSEIVHLAEQIQKSVQEKFGVTLKPEVNYIV